MTPSIARLRIKTARRIMRSLGRELLDRSDHDDNQAYQAHVSGLPEHAQRLLLLSAACRQAGHLLLDAIDADMTTTTPTQNNPQETDA
jgi:hypothetical protein